MTQEEKDLVFKFVETLPLGSCYDVSYAVARYYEHMEMIPILAKSENGITFHFANYDKNSCEVVDFTKHRMIDNGETDFEFLRIHEISQRDNMIIGTETKNKKTGKMWQLFEDASWKNNGYVDVENIKDTGVYILFEMRMKEN